MNILVGSSAFVLLGKGNTAGISAAVVLFLFFFFLLNKQAKIVRDEQQHGVPLWGAGYKFPEDTIALQYYNMNLGGHRASPSWEFYKPWTSLPSASILTLHL